MNHDDFGQVVDDAYAAGCRDGANDERNRTEHKLSACKTVLADRERELKELKGPCLGGPRSDRRCRLHRAHAGPCDIPPGDPICNERGIPESECPAYCLHTRPIPPSEPS